jgi:hypothetical protein
MIRTETDELEGSADPHRAPGRRVEARNQWKFKWLRGTMTRVRCFLSASHFRETLK